MANIEKTKNNLELRGFDVKQVKTLAEAADYLDSSIDMATVGISGSVTIQKMEGFGDRLSHHNAVFWHWFNAVDTHNAISSDVYITSANAIAETGEIVNIESRGNRVSSMLFGHDTLYIVVGVNKIVPTYEDALWRAQNIAAPQNAKRMSEIRIKAGKPPIDVPCAEKGDKCYNCMCPERICKVQLTHWRKPDFIRRAEVIIVEENLGL